MYKSISVFFPAMNEEDNIKSCIESSKKYLGKRFEDFEILIVTNGSTDNTDKIVKEFSKKDQRIKLVHEKLKGYGGALRSGFSNAKKELVFYTDSDNQFDIKELDKILPMLEKYDVVSGYRKNRRDPLHRIVTAAVYNLLVNILFNLWVKDIDSSFKLYKRDVLKKMKLRSKTGLIDAEMLIKAKNNGFKIGQVGVTHYPRTAGAAFYEIGINNSNLSIVRPKVVLDILKEIKLLWRDLK